MKYIKFRVLAIAAFAALLVFASHTTSFAQKRERSLSEQVRKELVTLPYYGVFDNLAYKVEGNTVTLYGQVLQPTTRKGAEKRVAKLDGVTNVVNNIETLPLSPFDDQIRRQTFRTLFNTGGLHRYLLGTNPGLHIIVKNGHITLEGVVANRGDARLANIIANGVDNAFSVTNNLRIENDNRAR